MDYDGFPTLLRSRIPGFDHVYATHVEDYDEVLPHVLVGELVRFLADEARQHGPASAPLRAAMELLESGMSAPDPRLQELVAVSFLENLDQQDSSFPAFRNLFGPALEDQFSKLRESGP